MKIVTTTSLPAVDRPNADRWNAARSRQYLCAFNQSSYISPIKGKSDKIQFISKIKQSEHIENVLKFRIVNNCKA